VIEVSIDVQALADKIASEIQALVDFPKEMAEEMTVWQREDMHRQYPNTDEDQDSASTEIWPRSRLTEEKHKQEAEARRRAYFMRRARSLRNVGSGARRGAGRFPSRRPILRDVLFDQLEDRMDALMVEKLGWP
jgi:hypothetical protein